MNIRKKGTDKVLYFVNYNKCNNVSVYQYNNAEFINVFIGTLPGCYIATLKMNIEEFRAELETRLIIEKQYLTQRASSMESQERLELLGEFNEKYRVSINRLANENGIDLNAIYEEENSSVNSDTHLSYEQVIFGKTMSIYDRLSDELYEEITNE